MCVFHIQYFMAVCISLSAKENKWTNHDQYFYFKDKHKVNPQIYFKIVHIYLF